jgi:hypothetical protein
MNVDAQAGSHDVLSAQNSVPNDETAPIAGVSDWTLIAAQWRAECTVQVAAAARVLLGDAPQPVAGSDDAAELEVADKLITRYGGRVDAIAVTCLWDL